MIELIPAIDLINGKCVRLSQGCYESKTTYDVDPVEVAKELESYGLRRIHIVDLDGAASHHIVNYRILEQIASRTSLVIDFGGGVKSESDLNIAFENGAQMVTVGSMAVKDPQQVEKWIEKYGSHRIILDTSPRTDGRKVRPWNSSLSSNRMRRKASIRCCVPTSSATVCCRDRQWNCIKASWRNFRRFT